LTTEQAKTLVDAKKGDRLEVLYRLCLTLGLRQGEALALMWDVIDFTAGSLSIADARQRVYDETTGKRKSTLQRSEEVCAADLLEGFFGGG
jgi:integrase